MKTKDLDTLLENEYAYEPPIQLLPKQKLMTPEAERFNGWAAMLGFVAALGAYVTTGQNNSRSILKKTGGSNHIVTRLIFF